MMFSEKEQEARLRRASCASGARTPLAPLTTMVLWKIYVDVHPCFRILANAGSYFPFI